MTFLAPVRAGDLLTVRARVDHAGRTSMDVGVVVTAERWNLTGPVTRVATAHLVFVAVDADGQPHRVPALDPATPADRRRQRRSRTGRPDRR